MDIPTLSTWDGFNNVGMQRFNRPKINNEEREQIKASLKRKTIKDVALQFNKHYSTIYKIAKETK